MEDCCFAWFWAPEVDAALGWGVGGGKGEVGVKEESGPRGRKNTVMCTPDSCFVPLSQLASCKGRTRRYSKFITNVNIASQIPGCLKREDVCCARVLSFPKLGMT